MRYCGGAITKIRIKILPFVPPLLLLPHSDNIQSSSLLVSPPPASESRSDGCWMEEKIKEAVFIVVFFLSEAERTNTHTELQED